MVSTSMAWEVFVVSHQTALQAKLELGRTLFGTALFVAGCFHSLEAAAASRIVAALGGQMLYRPHLARMTGASHADFYRIYLRSGAAAAAAVAPALGLMIFWRFAAAVPLLEVGGRDRLWRRALAAGTAAAGAIRSMTRSAGSCASPHSPRLPAE